MCFGNRPEAIDTYLKFVNKKSIYYSIGSNNYKKI
jgi:hypothetical protein